MSALDILLIAVGSIVVISLATALAPRVGIAGPLALVAIGLGVSLLPFVPPLSMHPEIILVGILPPLLYSAAVSLPAIEFRRDITAISGLSVLLVLISSLALAGFFLLVIPGLGFALALALGAILSPTDAVATSIAKRLGLSSRVVTILDGESLLNDATSLVILRSALAALALGTAPFGWGVPQFLWGVLLAAVVGTLVGIVNLRVRAWVANPAANTALSFVVPFFAYLPTEHLGGSGLVAAVVAGIVTGQGAARWFTPEQRISDELNWRTIELMLEGAVFLVMGLQLKEVVLKNIEDHQGILHAVWLAAAAFGIILAVRILYVTALISVQSRRAGDRHRDRLNRVDERLTAAELARPDPPTRQRRRFEQFRERVDRAILDADYYRAKPLGWRHGAVIVWAGMRGVVTLAAAQTLPQDATARPLLVLVAFIVAVGSLMLQGFTLPTLVRWLGLQGSGGRGASPAEQHRLDKELREAAAHALHAGTLHRLDGSAFEDTLLERVGDRMTRPPEDEVTDRAREALELRLSLLRTMRERLEELSSGGRFSTAALRHSLAELDADQLSIELRLSGEEG